MSTSPTLRAEAPSFVPSKTPSLMYPVRAEARPQVQPMYTPIPVAPRFHGAPSTAALRADNRPDESAPCPGYMAPQISTTRSTAHLYGAVNMLGNAVVSTVARSSLDLILDSPEAKFGFKSRPESFQRARTVTPSMGPRLGPTKEENQPKLMQASSLFKHEERGMNFTNNAKMSSSKLAHLEEGGVPGPVLLSRIKVEQSSYQPMSSAESDIDVELFQRPANPVPWHGPSSSQQSFQYKQGLHNESTNDHHSTSLRCLQCYKLFPSLNKLRAHIKIHPHAILHPCWECDESFVTKNALREHIMRYKHARPSRNAAALDTTVLCKTCFQEFGTKDDLWKHQKAKLHFGMEVATLAPPTSVMDVLVLAPHAKFTAKTSPDEGKAPKGDVRATVSRFPTTEQVPTAQLNAKRDNVVTPRPVKITKAVFDCDQCSRSFPAIERLDQHRRDAHKPKDTQTPGKLMDGTKEKEDYFKKTETDDNDAVPQQVEEAVQGLIEAQAEPLVSEPIQTSVQDTPSDTPRSSTDSLIAPSLDSSCADLNAATTVICICKKRIAFDDLEDHYHESTSCLPVPGLDSSRPDLTASTTVICTCNKRLPFADLEAHRSESASCCPVPAVDSSCPDLTASTTVVCMCKDRLAFDELEGHYTRSSDHPSCYYGECDRKGFVDHRALDEHMRLAHGDLRCDVCEYQELTIQDLERHVKDEHTYFQCALCAEVVYGRESYIAHHMETHPPRELIPVEAKEWQFFSEVKESQSSASSSGFSSVSSVSSSSVFSSPSWQDVALDSDYSRPTSAVGYR